MVEIEFRINPHIPSEAEADARRKLVTSYQWLKHQLYHDHPANLGSYAVRLIEMGHVKTVERASKSKRRATAKAAQWALKRQVR